MNTETFSENFIAKNQWKLKNYRDDFKRLFKLNLHQYWDITGFDAIKFDEEVIKPPDGESTAEAVERIYGKEACDLCWKLIN